MKLDFSYVPVGERGISSELVDKIWANITGSLERKGVEEFRREQREIVGSVSHNTSGAILTAYGKEVAMVLPFQYSKVALALMHLMENANVNAAMDEADQNPDQSLYDLEELIAQVPHKVPTVGHRMN